MVSFKHKVIMIHNPKTAGTAMMQCLRKDVWDDPWKGNESGFHELPSRCRKRLGADFFDAAFKFCFVRNPFDRMVSHYHYYQKSGNIFVEEYPTFESWVKDEPHLDDRHQNTTSQIQWCELNGKNVMNFIGRFEHLERDWKKLLELINVEYRPLRVVNPSEHKHYREYYNAETRAIVNRRFSRDFEAFGYEF